MSKNGKRKPEVVQPNPSKEDRAIYSFKITFLNKEHFYKVCEWLTANLGKSPDYWSPEGRPHRRLQNGSMVEITIYIFKGNFDESTALFLKLL